MLLPNRHGATDDYRYGFNGMESDDELSGEKNSYTAEYWQYDPRVGRRWNIDPVFVAYESPYAAFRNSPISLNDPNGDCPDCDENHPNPQENDVHIQKEKIRPFKAPNGEMLSGTDGKGLVYSDDLSYIAWVYTGDKGGWQAFAFETADGNKFIWDSEKAWYVSDDDEDFSDITSFNITNAIGANVSPVVQMAVDKYTKGDAFISIKEAIKRHDGGLGSFVWTGMKKSVSDLFEGGRKGSQARLTLFTGILSTGGPYGGYGFSESFAAFGQINRSIAIRYLARTNQLANFSDVDGFSFSFFRESYIWHNSLDAANRGGWWTTTQFNRAGAFSQLALDYSVDNFLFKNLAQYQFKTRVFGVSIKGTAAPQGLTPGGGLQHFGVRGYFYRTKLQLFGN